jgi:very-short-patch-repair endonuclease
MRHYHHTLQDHARHLRASMTDSERRLWERLRRKQLWGIQVYRQKPTGPYIADFYAPRVGLVIEIDGSQHLEGEHVTQDAQRDAYLQCQGLQVLRFHTTDVLQKLDEVVEVIYRVMKDKIDVRRPGINPP